MNAANRELRMIAVIALALLGAVWWCYGNLQDSRTAAANASADLTRCQDFAAQIEQLRGRPQAAGLQEMGKEALNALIERAAGDAAIPPQGLASISPGLAQRIDDTVYKEKPTTVLLRQVTLQQAIRFLYGVTSASPGLQVRSIRLSVPAGNQWQLDAKISYLIYSPANDRAVARRGALD